METRRIKVSKRKATYASKVKRAIHMLFYRRHKKPGVKGWELRKALGSDYPKVLKILKDENQQLYLDWRTRAEVDQKALVDLLLSK
jgi:hypothetical protein